MPTDKEIITNLADLVDKQDKQNELDLRFLQDMKIQLVRKNTEYVLDMIDNWIAELERKIKET